MRKYLALGLVVVGLVFCAAGFSGMAAADTLNGDVDFSFTLANHYVLTITYETGSPVAFGTVEPGVLASGNQHVTVNVKSNRTYTFGYEAGAEFSGGGNTIPISRMSWNATAFTDADTDLDIDHAKTGGGGIDYVYHYTLTTDWDDVPASYTGTVTYVVGPGS